MGEINVEITLSRGRPKDDFLKSIIVDAMRSDLYMNLCTPERMRKKVIEVLGRNVARITVYKHLEELVSQGFLRKRIVSEGEKRTIVVYGLPEYMSFA